MGRWPIYVEVFEDESISSWLVRCALEHGCDPLVLTGAAWPGWRVWTTDIDRGIPSDRLDVIGKYSRVEIQLQRAALSNEIRQLWPGDLPRHGLWPWVQGLGARNRRYRGGLQFCPMCFQNDVKPYFRRHWRFSWNTGCLIHNVQLVDRCPQCLKTPQPQLLKAMESSKISVCASCGFDLIDAPTKQVSPAAQRFQLRANSVIDGGTGEIAGNVVSVADWFATSRHLISILRRTTNFPDSKVARALYESGIDIRSLVPESLNLQLELLPIVTREPLFACLELLLSNMDLCVTNLMHKGASANSLWGRDRFLPAPLQPLVSQLIPIERRHERQTHVHQKPRSRTAILKSWARFKRKYGIE
jgi:hypothetical protein